MSAAAATPRWLALVLFGGCQLITDFTPQPTAETGDTLCSDGRDNDFNGVTDCQDWTCLATPTCCDVPEIILQDDFESGPADCAASCSGGDCGAPRCSPDAERWHTWPCPQAKVCGGSLHIDKKVCYPTGVLGRVELPLVVGLKIDVDLRGRPEQHGFLEVGLTVQNESDFPGSLDVCGTQQEPRAFVAIRQVAVAGGVQMQALFQGVVIGTSQVVVDVSLPQHTQLALDAERRIVYSLNGEVFAIASQSVPAVTSSTRLILTGLTDLAVVDRVRVQAGLLCHDPIAWRGTRGDVVSSVALDASDMAGVFDADEVYHPSVTQTDADLRLYYTGCRWSSSNADCDSSRVGIGLAIADGDGAFVRDPGSPVVLSNELPGGGGHGATRADLSVGVIDGELVGYVAALDNAPILGMDSSTALTSAVLISGPAGAWDGGELCCVSALQHPDGTTYLWYAATAALGSNTWQLGLATSSDGVNFVRHPANPVLRAGTDGSFDSEGVRNPSVIYDPGRALFMMWYEGRDFFGVTRLGVAVSLDGVTWTPYPGNPILGPAEVGLATLGGPSVHAADGGTLRMWVHGTTAINPRKRIFELENVGAHAPSERRRVE